MERLKAHALEQGYQIVATLSEIGSGVNENRSKLHRLLGQVRDEEVDVVVIVYRDRLARFGYRYLERYMADFGAQLEMVEEEMVNGNSHEELVEDLIAIVTSLSARIYGARGASVVKKVEEALEDEDHHPDTDA
jgi:predicted site-specific integrase-resolvase